MPAGGRGEAEFCYEAGLGQRTRAAVEELPASEGSRTRCSRRQSPGRAKTTDLCRRTDNAEEASTRIIGVPSPVGETK